MHQNIRRWTGQHVLGVEVCVFDYVSVPGHHRILSCSGRSFIGCVVSGCLVSPTPADPNYSGGICHAGTESSHFGKCV